MQPLEPYLPIGGGGGAFTSLQVDLIQSGLRLKCSNDPSPWMHGAGGGLCFLLFFFFLSHRAACGIFVLQPGIEPRPSTVRARSPNHWTARESPVSSSLRWGSSFVNSCLLSTYYMPALWEALPSGRSQLSGGQNG